ncbi:MAG TPA: O-antigen ligase family protein [Gaiellaceae bacterium]|nr:O-antigen ligase family protein [Gaiellaceae bacterium]
MERVELAEAAAIAGAVAAPLVLLARTRLVLAAGLVLLAAAETALAFALLPDQLEAVFTSPARGGAAVVGLVALAGFAALLVRFPILVPAGLLVAAPVRLPVALRDEEAFLLLPLYGVLAAAALALLYRLARGSELHPLPLFLAVPAAAFVGLASLSYLWSGDPREGAVDLFFFLFPFTVLAVVVAQVELSRAVARVLAAVVLACAAAVAAIGLWQQWTHTLFFADDLQASNAYTSFFRVTSIFADSSIYGRYVALGIVVVLVLLWLDRLRPAAGLPLLALLLAGLYFSYSQSTFVALFVVILLVALVAGDRRSRQIVAAAAAALVLAGAGLVAATVQEESARRATSDRWPLVSLTMPVFLDNPVVGVGIGAQPYASTQLEDARPRKNRNVSHTTPLTVAAELGVLGILAYSAFLVAAARGAVLSMRRERALGLVLLAVLVLLVVHSLSYSGFFEDPFTWLVLGVAAACLATMPEPRGEPPPAA